MLSPTARPEESTPAAAPPEPGRARRGIPRWAWAIALVIGATLAIGGTESMSDVEASVALTVTFAVAVLLVTTPVLRRDFRVLRERWLLAVTALPGLWILNLVVGAVASALAGGHQVSANQQGLQDAAQSIPWYAMAVLTVLAAPIVEEYLFRHLLIGRTSRWLGSWVPALISVAAFTAVHFAGHPGPVHPVQVIPYLTLAIAITAGYLILGRNLLYAIVLHAFNNAIALMVLPI